MKIPRPIHRKNAFTLIEVVVAVGLMAMLVGMVFSTSRASLALGNNIVETQNENMLQQAFFELLENRFSSLPGNTRFDLTVQDSGSHYISDLTLQNVPVSFNWGGEAKVAKAIQLSTVKRRSGFLDIVLRYYENEILKDSATSFESSATSNEPYAEIVLMQDVAYFEWRALDGRSMEWQDEWDIQGRLPLQLELVMAVGARGEEIRQIFWIPPKQSPEVITRGMSSGGDMNSGGGGGGGLGGGGGPGGGGGGPGGGGTNGSGRPPQIQTPQNR